MTSQLYVLPKPQQLERRQGTFRLHAAGGIVLVDNSCKDGFFYARLLQTSIEEMTGISIPVLTDACCESPDGKIYLESDEHLGTDVYELKIDTDTIHISGHSGVDILHGVQTLRQIISSQGALLPCLSIHDYPEIKHRGFYHDVTRGRIPSLDSLKRLADRCSYYKINELQLYVEHTYLFKDSSEMWRDETPLTAEEIMEFDQYCQKLGVDLIPSISTFGHLYKLLETKTYAHLCELDGGESRPFSFFRRMRHHTLDASNPDSVKLMLAHIDEYMSLFTSKYFNICADETFDLGRGKSAAMTQELGREEVYIRFVKQLCDHVVSRGKIPMFWGDIIASRPEKISVLPKETICLNWGYDPNQSDEAVKSLKTAGAVQYLCPGVQGWNDFINVMPDAYANISRMCRYAYTYDIPGVLNTDWGDCGHVSHPDFSAFGLICGASFSWNREIPDYETICRQVSVVEYKDDTENIMQYISNISTQNVFRWLFIVLFKEMKQSLMADDPKLEQGIKKLQSRAAESITEEKVRQANAAIMDGMDKLAVYLHRAPENVKQTIHRLLNAAKGQMIFNEIALYIFRNCGDKLCPAENSRCSGDELYMPEKSRNCGDELCPPEKSCRCGEALCFPEKTAAALERWFMDYKRIWREYGKEGDLRHIQALVCWYGDYLRQN